MTESRTLCVNHKRFFHQMRIREIKAPFDLLAWLKAQQELPKIFWHGRDDIEVAACGSELMLHEVPQFDKGNDSSARFWGGHAFFPCKTPKDSIWQGFPRYAFFIPQIELVRKGKTITIIEHAINRPLRGDARMIIPKFFEEGKISLKEDSHLPCKKNWNIMIDFALDQIREKLFQKVVIARRTTHSLEGELDPFKMLAQVNAGHAIRFALQFSKDTTFIGATPERLYLRKGLDLCTEAIAGTCSIEEPLSTLLDSTKMRHEFNLVKTSIQEELTALCQSLSCKDDDHVISTPNARHLYNSFQGFLKSGVSDDQILTALHPTAAMGGLPKKYALDHIEKIEPFERGWYASPIGYISQDKAELCVGIRSALVAQNQLHLFAGTGIVEGSQPDKEWEELQTKTSLWRNS